MAGAGKEEGKELTCQKCQNTWIYKGANPYWATCPRCLSKVKVEDKK